MFLFRNLSAYRREIGFVFIFAAFCAASLPWVSYAQDSDLPGVNVFLTLPPFQISSGRQTALKAGDPFTLTVTDTFDTLKNEATADFSALGFSTTFPLTAHSSFLSSGELTLPASISDGEKVITVTAQTWEEQTIVLTLSVVVDNVPPIITLDATFGPSDEPPTRFSHTLLSGFVDGTGSQALIRRPRTVEYQANGTISNSRYTSLAEPITRGLQGSFTNVEVPMASPTLIEHPALLAYRLTVLDEAGHIATVISDPVPLVYPTGVLIDHTVASSVITAPNYSPTFSTIGIGIPHDLLNTLPKDQYYVTTFFEGSSGCPGDVPRIQAFRPGIISGVGVPFSIFPVRAQSTAGGGCMQILEIDPTRTGDWLFGVADFTEGYINAVGDSEGVPAFAVCADATSCNNLSPTTSTAPSVLFIPGIEASRLYGAGSGGEERLWEPGNNLDALELLMNPDGTSYRSDIYTRDIIDNAYVPIKGNVYKSLIEDLDDLKSDGVIHDWAAAPYDWRLTLDQILDSGTQDGENISYLTATSTPYIEQELRRLARTSQSGKVSIIAHSNGGLVAKALMQKLGDTEAAALIDKVIFVAVPQVGTPQALAALLHGYDQGLPTSRFSYALDAETIRAVGDTLPGLFTLIPSAEYFTYVDDPVFTFSTTSLASWADKYGEVVHSAETQHLFLADASRPAPSVNDLNNPTILSSAHLSNAETVHQSLDAWEPPEGVETTQIAGWGIPTTVSGIDYVQTLDQGNLTVYPFPRFVIDGDGTVVTPSALWLSADENVSNYWLNLGLYSDDHWISSIGGVNGLAPFTHASIFEVDELRGFVFDIVTDSLNNILPNYFSNEAPPSTETRLLYALHSPLSLDLYDNQGRHTGVSTTTGEIDEEIPGTYYAEFSETKYAFTDTDIPVRLVLDGYADGTFTLDVNQYVGDTVTATKSWKDVPTTAGTIITLDAPSDIFSLSTLRIDKDGDGLVDYDLSTKYRFDGFLDPIHDTAYHPDLPASVFKAGSTVPVKFQLTDVNGTPVKADTAPVWLPPSRLGPLDASTAEVASTEAGTTGNTYRWVAEDEQYVYNWKTKGMEPGYWYRLYAQLDDGNTYSVVVGLR